MTPSENVIKIIYIGGYGRSGSTFLDLLLGQHRNISSGGELVNAPNSLASPLSTCSCGKFLSACAAWHAAHANYALPPDHKNTRAIKPKKNIISNETAAGRVKSKILEFIFDRKYFSQGNPYREFNRFLFKSIGESQNTDFVVDSSKTSYSCSFRPKELEKIFPNEVYFVHLVRHPLSVIASIKNGTNKGIDKGRSITRSFNVLRGFVGWSIANYFSLLNMKALGKDRSITVLYENLIKDPESEIKKIMLLIGQDPDDIYQFIRGHAVQSQAHICAGNRMRKKPLTINGGTSTPKSSVKERFYYQLFCSKLMSQINENL